MPHRLAPLHLGLGIDEVGEPFDRTEVHLVVEKGPTGKLAGLRRPAPRDRGQRPEHRRHDGAAAMELAFGYILAGEARGSGKPEEERPIQDLASSAKGC